MMFKLLLFSLLCTIPLNSIYSASSHAPQFPQNLDNPLPMCLLPTTTIKTTKNTTYLPIYLYTLWPIRLNNKSFAFHMPSSPQNLALRALMTTHVFMARRKALNPSRQPPFCRRRCQQPYTHPKNSKQ